MKFVLLGMAFAMVVSQAVMAQSSDRHDGTVAPSRDEWTTTVMDIDVDCQGLPDWSSLPSSVQAFAATALEESFAYLASAHEHLQQVQWQTASRTFQGTLRQADDSALIPCTTFRHLRATTTTTSFQSEYPDVFRQLWQVQLEFQFRLGTVPSLQEAHECRIQWQALDCQ